MTDKPTPEAFLKSLRSIERVQAKNETSSGFPPEPWNKGLHATTPHAKAILAAPTMKAAILYARSVGLDGYVARRIRYAKPKGEHSGR